MRGQLDPMSSSRFQLIQHRRNMQPRIHVHDESSFPCTGLDFAATRTCSREQRGTTGDNPSFTGRMQQILRAPMAQFRLDVNEVSSTPVAYTTLAPSEHSPFYKVILHESPRPLPHLHCEERFHLLLEYSFTKKRREKDTR
jgi:hypothetical protein